MGVHELTCDLSGGRSEAVRPGGGDGLGGEEDHGGGSLERATGSGEVGKTFTGSQGSSTCGELTGGAAVVRRGSSLGSGKEEPAGGLQGEERKIRPGRRKRE